MKQQFGLLSILVLLFFIPRFAVNLTCDEGDDSDIALHFNPRFGERQVVCNTREGGDWQEEVVTEKEEFPFEKKDAFEIAISVKDDKFVVGWPTIACSHGF